MRTTFLTALMLGLMATTSMASDDQSGHGEHGTMDNGTMDHGTMDNGTMDHGTMGNGDVNHAMMQDGIHAEVTVNSISDETVNVSHGPIPEIGWPAMTMDLDLMRDAEVGELEAGDAAIMMLEKGEDGMFAIRALMPME